MSDEATNGQDTNFFSKGKSAVAKHTVTGLIVLLISSVIPMLEQWHQEKSVSDAISESEKRSKDAITEAEKRNHDSSLEVETRLEKEFSDFKEDQYNVNKSLWEFIQSKQTAVFPVVDSFLSYTNFRAESIKKKLSTNELNSLNIPNIK